jgi:hypothetical protein
MAQITLPQYGETVFTSVASSASSVTLLASNPQRKRVFISNASTAILYIRMDTTGQAATATSGHSIQMAANTNLEIVGFTGVITGIWASANGFANMTELK